MAAPQPAENRPAHIAWQNAIITAIVPRTPTVKSFFLSPAEPFDYRAGQHVDVRLTAPDGYQARRGYSIASAPESGEVIELAIERLDEGEVSPFFHEVAATGDEIELRGPLGGHFVWSAGDGDPILLVGGGSGVVPLMAMVRHRAASGSRVPMTLLYSARNFDEVIFRDELLELAGRGDGFSLALALTRGGHQPARYARRIDAAMATEIIGESPAPVRAYVCGSNSFVDAATDALIAAGLPAGIIRTERYGT